MSRRRPRKRTVRVVLEAKNVKDPRSILKAIEHACHEAVGGVPNTKRDSAEQPDPSEPTQTVPNEQLETEANRRVGAHLEQNAQQIAAKREAAGQSADARVPESPEKVVAKRGRLRRWIDKARAQGYRFTIKVVADLIKELSQP